MDKAPNGSEISPRQDGGLNVHSRHPQRETREPGHEPEVTAELSTQVLLSWHNPGTQGFGNPELGVCTHAHETKAKIHGGLEQQTPLWPGHAVF